MPLVAKGVIIYLIVEIAYFFHHVDINFDISCLSHNLVLRLDLLQKYLLHKKLAQLSVLVFSNESIEENIWSRPTRYRILHSTIIINERLYLWTSGNMCYTDSGYFRFYFVAGVIARCLFSSTVSWNIRRWLFCFNARRCKRIYNIFITVWKQWI